MSDGLKILESAIADVGYWSWWTGGDVDNAIQIEFGGVQLWSPPLADGKPPNGQIALRFERLKFVAFLTRVLEGETAPANWPEMMARDELGKMGVDEGEFTLTDATRLRTILDAASTVDVRLGEAPILSTTPVDGAFIGMWAGCVGIVIVAESMAVLNHAGGIREDEIAALHNKWWEYWKAYWKSKDTDTPMPRDFACEVTIPIGWA